MAGPGNKMSFQFCLILSHFLSLKELSAIQVLQVIVLISISGNPRVLNQIYVIDVIL